jgi:sulfite reductase (ferredoxin)
MPGFYALFVGGDFEGTRLNVSLIDKVPLNGIAEILDPLFALFASARAEGEGFGDFCNRTGMPALQQALAERQKGAA